MARYTGPQWKISRRLGFSILENGKELNRRAYAPGQGIHGYNFLCLLERRLDNVVYRLGFASTRRQARQLVNHGHFLVNGVKTDIPSYRVNIGDVIEVREKSLNLAVIKEALENIWIKLRNQWIINRWILQQTWLIRKTAFIAVFLYIKENLWIQRSLFIIRNTFTIMML